MTEHRTKRKTKMAKVVAKPEDKLAVGKHCGPNIWGYEVLPDGSIELSPGFADQMRRVLDRHAGLLIMQEGIAAFVAGQLTQVEKEKREWWDALQLDLAVPIAKGIGWTFNNREGVVTRPKDDPDSEKPE